MNYCKDCKHLELIPTLSFYKECRNKQFIKDKNPVSGQDNYPRAEEVRRKHKECPGFSPSVRARVIKLFSTTGVKK